MNRFWQAILVALIGAVSAVVVALVPRFYPPEEPVKPAPTPTVTSDTDCADVANQRICWGKGKLAASNAHTRSFSFTFAQPFAGEPVIATSIDPVGSGYAFAAYNTKLGEESYSGRLVEVNGRATTIPVSMSYIAIGRPR